MSSLSRSILFCALALSVCVAALPPVVSGAQGDCSQPVSTGGSAVASDCLFILNVAVGLQACTPRDCVCDVNGDTNRTASDALVCLRAAVGESISLQCPCNTTTTTTIIRAECKLDGNCLNDDCVCTDCDDDLFCGNPDNCNHDGKCRPFNEGCVCADCTTHPECIDN